MSVRIAALYRFEALRFPETVASELRHTLSDSGVRGTLIVATEGINGTIAGSEDGITTALRTIRRVTEFGALDVKESRAETMPFRRLKVRVKPEIVTFGQPEVKPSERVGTYVSPEDWNEVITRDDVVVIDTRNDYETAIGTFTGAIDPGTASFREFADWWAEHEAEIAGRPVAMFCTGGIRCEKASSWLLSQGLETVFHLKGGILKYLEDVPEAQSQWQGKCFVFDERVSVGHGLAEGEHVLCHACRRPLTPGDLDRPEYQPGVSCHQCLHEKSDEDRRRFAERQRQLNASRRRAGDA